MGARCSLNPRHTQIHTQMASDTDTEKLETFLEINGLSRYVETLSEHSVGWKDLQFVETDDDLLELGVDLKVHRRKLLSLLSNPLAESLPTTLSTNEPIAAGQLDLTPPRGNGSPSSPSTVAEISAPSSTNVPTPPALSSSSSTTTTTTTIPSSSTRALAPPPPSEDDMLVTAWADYDMDEVQRVPRDALILLNSDSHMSSELREEYLSGEYLSGEYLSREHDVTAMIENHEDHHEDHRELEQSDQNFSLMQIQDKVLLHEHATFLEMEEEVAKYRRRYLQERAERLQSSIENERAMIDVQTECDENKRRMRCKVESARVELGRSEESCDVMRKEVSALSTTVQALERAIKTSSHDAELTELKQRVVELEETARRSNEELDMLTTKLQTAEDMKCFLTSEWEKAESEASHFKEQLLASATDKGAALEFRSEMEELLSFLSRKLKINEEDRGLRLAVKEEWSRLLMESKIMQMFFVVEREVNMIPSWVLRQRR